MKGGIGLKRGLPLLTCGKTFAPDLPDQHDRSEPPIILGKVAVDTRSIQDPCVLTKYSEFIQFTLLGINSKLRICYRLVRIADTAQILQEWEFLYDSTARVGIGDLDTIQPTVLNVCDCLKKGFRDKLTYQLEIVEIETNGVQRFGLRNQVFTATSITGESEH